MVYAGGFHIGKDILWGLFMVFIHGSLVVIPFGMFSSFCVVSLFHLFIYFSL